MKILGVDNASIQAGGGQGTGARPSVSFSDPLLAFLLVFHGHSFLWSKNPLPSPPLPELQLYC